MGGIVNNPNDPNGPYSNPKQLDKQKMDFLKQGYNPAGTDAGPRPFESPYPLQPQGPLSGQVPGYAQPYIQNMFNGNQQPQELYSGLGVPFRFDEPLRLPTQIQPQPINYANIASNYPNINPAEIIDLQGMTPGGPAYNQRVQELQAQGVNIPIQNSYQTKLQQVQSKPTPIPGRPIIEPPRPGYGQKPQRGPVDRGMTPVTLQQGLGGLANRR